jgi:hypothetical protein
MAKFFFNASKCLAIGLVGATALSTMFSFRTIPAGHIGYKDLFGNVSDKQYQSGFTFINPLSQMIRLDLRKRSHTANH